MTYPDLSPRDTLLIRRILEVMASDPTLAKMPYDPKLKEAFLKFRSTSPQPMVEAIHAGTNGGLDFDYQDEVRQLLQELRQAGNTTEPKLRAQLLLQLSKLTDTAQILRDAAELRAQVLSFSSRLSPEDREEFMQSISRLLASNN